MYKISSNPKETASRASGLGARQPRENWTGEFTLWRPGDGGRESENCSLSIASSSTSELQAVASRREVASGAARWWRTADSRSKTASLARKVLRVKFSQYLQLEMPKIASRAWARPTHLTHLPCWSTLAMRWEHGGWHRLKSIPLTARRITIPQMRSLKWKESQTKNVVEKWARKTARSECFWREENLRGKMARAWVYVNHVWRRGGISRHQPMNWRDSIRASDNRHTWGCSRCVKLRSVEWTYEREHRSCI